MNKVLLLVLILLILNNCSASKKVGFWGEGERTTEGSENIKIILTDQARVEIEFNPTLEIKFSEGEFNKDFKNNQNDIGELSYEGNLEKLGKLNFSKFKDFAYPDIQPVFYNENIIFFDGKGSIIYYDKNQKKIWEKNFYNKYEKKLKPKLNFAIHKDLLIITDNIAKYYAIDIKTGNIIWFKNNIAPFNSEIKIKDDIFYTVDYKNILRSISIKDGSELWILKREESLTKSSKKISIIIKEENIYFNNSIGDITAVNLKSGQFVWQSPTQSNNTNKNSFQLSNSKLVLNENSILFSNNRNEFYSIDTTTGLVNWKNEINSDLGPVIIDRFIITISNKGFLYIIDKKIGNILRINDLYQGYKVKKRKNILVTGFIVAQNKVYISNSDGNLIITDLNTGRINNIHKISSDKILQPYVNNNNLFLIRNGSIFKFN